MSFKAFPLSPEQAAESAGQWQPFLQPAIDDADGRWTWRQCLADVLTGSVVVWLIIEEIEAAQKVVGVCTVRLFHGAKVPWLLIEDLAGERFDEWVDVAYQTLEDRARQNGYQQIVLEGRGGWARKMARFGFNPTRVQCVKKLSEV